MMRRQVLSSLRRSQQLARLNAVQQQQQTSAFSTTRRRNAEVELTVDGKKVSIEGAFTTNIILVGRAMLM